MDCYEDALSLPSVECDDCSDFDGKIARLQETLNDAVSTINTLQTKVTSLETALANKQTKLVAGDGIEIVGNEISSITRAMC